MEHVDGVLEDWFSCRSGDGVRSVTGRVSGDGEVRCSDGAPIRTSVPVGSGIELTEGMVIAASDSRHLLGRRAAEVDLATLLHAAGLGGSIGRDLALEP